MAVSWETLAALAGQGGADVTLDNYIFEPPSKVETGDQYNFGEGINVALKESKPVEK